MTLKLEPLNVLIGPNASGKSNFIAAISLIAAAPRNFLAAFREGGSAEDWLWKGVGEPAKKAQVKALVDYPEGKECLTYFLAFDVPDFQPRIVDEALIPESLGIDIFSRGHRTYKLWKPATSSHSGLLGIESQQSVLAVVKDPLNYPQLTYLGNQLEKIVFFRGWPFGRDNILRRPQAVNLPDDFLLEDASNLGLIINDLQNRRETKRLILENLRLLYEGVEDVTTKVQGGTIQIFFHEEGLNTPIPAARLSDGTLHYLCLLAVLLHPEPPPLICIEEPELGMHPDVIPIIAKLLVDATKRTQLIVTTHSESLVSALSEVPESVVVCERDDRGTRLQRLEPAKLKDWLERYRLGELWAMGEIGGNR